MFNKDRTKSKKQINMSWIIGIGCNAVLAGLCAWAMIKNNSDINETK
jgi:hypothetical protein